MRFKSLIPSVSVTALTYTIIANAIIISQPYKSRSEQLRALFASSSMDHQFGRGRFSDLSTILTQNIYPGLNGTTFAVSGAQILQMRDTRTGWRDVHFHSDEQTDDEMTNQIAESIHGTTESGVQGAYDLCEVWSWSGWARSDMSFGDIPQASMYQQIKDALDSTNVCSTKNNYMRWSVFDLQLLFEGHEGLVFEFSIWPSYMNRTKWVVDQIQNYDKSRTLSSDKDVMEL